MKNIRIEHAKDNDYPEIYRLLEEAFKNDPESDQNEAQIVRQLYASNDFIPAFSLVAKLQTKIVGYLLLTPVRIENSELWHQVLALAPLAVLPKYQSRGIGSALVMKAHEIAAKKGYPLIVLIGHDTYYPRFGYQEAKLFGIKVPFRIPSRFVMVKVLEPNTVKNISGKVKYPAPFYL